MQPIREAARPYPVESTQRVVSPPEASKMRQRSYQRTVPDTGSTGNHMESSVTRLLVATKMLLEALTLSLIHI